MKIRCPVCKTVYNIHAEQISKPIVKASCKRCGNTLVIHKDTGKVETTASSPPPLQKLPEKKIPKPTSIPPSLTVRTAGGAGSNNRPILAMIVVLLLIVAVGYYFVSSSGMGLFTESGDSVSKVVKGPNKFKVCKSYVRQNKKLLAAVGKFDKITLLNDESLGSKSQEISRVTVQVQGSKGKKRLKIMLLKEEKQWRVISAIEEPKVAKDNPRSKHRKKPATKTSPSEKKPIKIRLPVTTTNKQLAD